MKYLSLIPLLALCACGDLCACGEIEKIRPDQSSHYIEWPGGACMGKVNTHSQLTHSGTQFIAECEDGRIVYNLSNFTVK